MSSESTTPLTKRNHFGKILSVRLFINTFLVYNATPVSVSLDNSNKPGRALKTNCVNSFVIIQVYRKYLK